MFHRHARWAWLTLFALANLTCWISVAVVAGLAIGDDVDLGIETFLRERQATAVATWRQASQKALAPPPAPTAVPRDSSPTHPNVQHSSEASKGAPSPTISWSDSLVPAVGTEAIGTPGASTVSAASGAASVPSDLPPEQPAVTLVSSPLALVDPEIKSLESLDTEMARSAPDRTVEIRYQEDALNREIATLWMQNPEFPFRDVRVDLQDGLVILTGKANVLGVGVNAKATCSLVAQDCLPHLQVETVSVAGVLAPEFVKERIADMLVEAMTWYPQDYPLCLEQILLEEAQVTVYGHCR